jgi:hypothetical protein
MNCWNASLNLCLLLLLAGCRTSPPAAERTSPKPTVAWTNSPTLSVAGVPNPARTPGTNGPTLRLDTSRGPSPDNPIADFMYFVPLISPDPVAVSETQDNTQQARLLTSTRHFGAEKFSATCEFEITGAGSQRNVFDPTNHLRSNAQRLKDGGVLERQLDTIVVSGVGRGRIEVEGVMSNAAPVATEVRLRFNDAGKPSPVTIGLHDFRWVDGAVRAENAVVVRVNTLTFRRAPGRPKMEVSVASVKRADAGNGLWQQFVGGMTGLAANLFLKPITVDRTGHEAMLAFGRALAMGETQFTFPRAKNLQNKPAPEL